MRGEHSIVVLNRFPYNNGHLLIAPREHKADLRDLNDAELLETNHLLQKMLGLLEKTISPDGFNVGLNLGRVAGAGLPGHLHWHIVPRWNGDTNFMPILGEAKVIPQALDALLDLLSKEMSAESESPS
jgi:ATP adenylyltransferase